MASRLENIFADVNTSLQKIEENPLVKNARKSIKEMLANYTLTEEDRAAQLIDFEIRLALGMYEKALLIGAESDVVAEKLALAKLEKLAKLAEIRKQWGYVLATENDLGANTAEGVIDKQARLLQMQIDGFDADQIHKANKTISEVMFGLAMNGTAAEKWMVDAMKIMVEIQTNGLVDFENIANPSYNPADPASPQEITTVVYNGSAITPDGI